MEDRKHQEALKYFEKVEGVIYENRNFQFIKGVIYSEIGEKDKAIKIFEKLIELDKCCQYH